MPKHFWVVLIAVISIFILMSSHAALTAGNFDVSIAAYKNGRYVKPLDRKIRVWSQPMTFHVIIKNISSSSARISKKAMAGKDNAVTLEMTDEKGFKRIIKKKKEQLSSQIIGFRRMKPGEEKVIHLLIDPDKWENVPVLEEGKEYKFRMRAIYDNNFTKLYSDYYKVIIGSDRYSW